MAIKPTKQALHKEEIKTKILETAERLFREYGYENVSMRDIAAEIGATTGTLYHHFKNKEDILASIPRFADSSIALKLDDIRASSDALAELKNFYIDIMGKRVCEDGVRFTRHRVFNVLHMDHPGIVDRTTALCVKRGLELGQVRDDRPEEEITDFLVSVFRGAVYYYAASEGESDLQQTLEKRLTFAFDAVKK